MLPRLLGLAGHNAHKVYRHFSATRGALSQTIPYQLCWRKPLADGIDTEAYEQRVQLG